MFPKSRPRQWLTGPLRYVLVFALLAGLVIGIFSFISGTSTVEVLAAIRERGTIKVGVIGDMLPFSQMDTDGKAKGFEADLAAKLGEKVLGTAGVQFFSVNSKDALAYLQNGDCDILFAMVVYNSTNQASYSLSDPYVQEDVTLISKGGSMVSMQTSDTKIGVIRGSDSKSVLTAYISGNRFNATVVDIESYPDAIIALGKGTITAFCAPRSVLQKYVSNGIAISPVTIGQLNYSFAVKKTNIDLYEAFVNALRELKKEGGLNPLYTTYALQAPLQ